MKKYSNVLITQSLYSSLGSGSELEDANGVGAASTISTTFSWSLTAAEFDFPKAKQNNLMIML